MIGRFYWQYRGWFWIALIAALGALALSARDEAPTAVVVISVGAAAVVVFVAAVYLLVRFIKWAAKG